MIRLSTIIKTFEAGFLAKYQQQLLPSHKKALSRMATCRTAESPKVLAGCPACEHHSLVPHSCGHRNCPHCQSHESQRWLSRQLSKELPVGYFLITFTLPAQFRSLAWCNQRTLYSCMMRCAWDTVRDFTLNDKQLKGAAGATQVLHTHNRALGYHPHVHLLMPAAAVDPGKRLWREKRSRGKKHYLFNHRALAKVFRAKMLEAITEAGITLPEQHPATWVVDCKSVGSGRKALVYLGRYLYRGVIQEKDIIACKDGKVTYRYMDSKTRRWVYKTVPGETFLWLLMQHLLPKGFRRARNFGFLHPNSIRLIQLVQYLLNLRPIPAIEIQAKRPRLRCKCCGAAMKILLTQIFPSGTCKIKDGVEPLAM
jgi:hypothetical protein